MTVRVRLSGQPDQLARVVALLRATYDTSGGDRSYPNRGAVGVRVYLDVHATTPPTTKTTTDDAARKS
ncbi:hypothetical protein [Kribbella sp. NPDC049227]|uniref:hypothetical protein n=1 Tax=Kribbella sp. NPDC049227 TaxID=3364113 RepID=UPI003724C0A7